MYVVCSAAHISVCRADIEEREVDGGGRSVCRGDEIREWMSEVVGEVRAEEVTEDEIDV